MDNLSLGGRTIDETNRFNQFDDRFAKIISSNSIDYEQVSKKKISDFIPCLLLKYHPGSSKIFLYFHANAEDLGKALKFLTYVNVYLKMHVIAVEYPGYGVYQGDTSNAEKIISDADIVYNFILKELFWKE